MSTAPRLGTDPEELCVDISGVLRQDTSRLLGRHRLQHGCGDPGKALADGTESKLRIPENLRSGGCSAVVCMAGLQLLASPQPEQASSLEHNCTKLCYTHMAQMHPTAFLIRAVQALTSRSKAEAECNHERGWQQVKCHSTAFVPLMHMHSRGKSYQH